MRGASKKLILIYAVLFVYLIISFFMSFTTSKLFLYLNPLLLLFISFITYYLTNGLKIRNRNKYSKIQNVIIVTISYCIIYFLFGLIFGFLKNGHDLSVRGIITNFIIYFSVVILKEYLRCRMICTNKSKNSLIIITLLFILLDLEFKSLININSNIMLAEYLFNTFVPIVFINIISTYLVYRIGMMPNYIYRGVLEGITLFSPILPKLNWFVNNMLLFLFLIIIVFLIDNIVDLENKKVKKRLLKKGNSFSTYCLFVVTMIFVLFVVGVFKYKPIAILSNSMKGEFSRGDAVIIERIKKDDLETIKKNDIIYYKYDGKYITHRVVNIAISNNSYIFYTKGDNNDYVDEWQVNGYAVEGIVRLNIKYVGWPSVWLNTLLG